MRRYLKVALLLAEQGFVFEQLSKEGMMPSDEPLQTSAAAARTHHSTHTAAASLLNSGAVDTKVGRSDGSSDNSSSDDDDNDSDDESLLPVDRDSLQDDMERVNETIQRIEEGTADDFVLGCELLLASKQTQVTRAYANFERFKQTAIQLYEYECEQAKARYHARCEELKQEMSDELQREIQRLKNTRDGVSVMDRRRLTRNSGGGAKGFDQKRHGSGGGVSIVHGTGGVSGLGALGIGNSSNAVQQKIRPLTPGEEAYRLQFEEKKRLELLLSKTPVFKQLNQRVESEEVNSDLAAIAHAVQKRSGAPFDHIVNGKNRVAFPPISSSAGVLTSKKNNVRVFSSDDEDSYGSYDDSDVGSYQTEDESESNVDDRQLSNEVRRLAHNSGMLQEGDKVVVVYRNERNDEEMKSQDDASEENHEELHNREERVLSGVITASTSTRVFLLCANGKFETIDVSDWKAGRVSVHAAETHRKRKR